MNIHDLGVLRRDDRQQGLYNMFDRTYADPGLGTEQHVVMPDEEMRIDLICSRIYSTTDHVDLLLNMNNILNPLSIMAGDVLVYPTETNLQRFKVTPPVPAESRDSLLTPQRANIKDPRRQDFIENNYQLPPTMLPSPVSPVVVGRNAVFIRPVR
jgi:hypothetical protein